MADPVSDPRDVRVMIPRVRRATEGPMALASGMVQDGLNDDAITALIADSIASVIFYSGSLFGHQLEVVERDQFYMAPIAWRTDTELTEAEQTVVVAEAALSHFMHTLYNLKTSEEISDEGQTWSYTYSAQVISAHMDVLRSARDRALEEIAETLGKTFDAYHSFVAERDAGAAMIAEPWVPGMARGGQEDHRFAGW